MGPCWGSEAHTLARPIPRAQHVLEDGTVRIFSRNSEDTTTKYPDLGIALKMAMGRLPAEPIFPTIGAGAGAGAGVGAGAGAASSAGAASAAGAAGGGKDEAGAAEAAVTSAVIDVDAAPTASSLFSSSASSS